MAVRNRLTFERPTASGDQARKLRIQLALLQRIWSGFSAERPLQPLLHTHKGYRRVLYRSGLRVRGLFAVHHSRKESSVAQLCPVASLDLPWKAARNGSLAECFRIRQLFAPAYWILAQHDGERCSSSLLHSILERISADTCPACSSALEVEGFELRPKNKVLLRVLAGECRLFVKIPLDEASRKGAQRNWRMLALMQRRGVNTPTPVSCGWRNGLYFFVETQLFEGSPSTQPAADVQLEQFERLHEALNPDLEKTKPITLTDGRFRTLVQRPLDIVLSVVHDRDVARCARQVIEASLHGLVFRPGIVHGDLSLSNLCVGRDGRLGIIDWEVGTLRGLPVMDAMDHLLARYRARRRRSFAEAIRHFYEGTWPDADERDLLSRAMTRSGIPAERASDVGILYWLRYVAPHVEDGTIFLADGIRRRILTILMGILSFKLGEAAPDVENPVADLPTSGD